MLHFPCKCPPCTLSDVDYFQIALCRVCRRRMFVAVAQGPPLLINNQLNKGAPALEMSLSGSPKEKSNNSTCFELAEKLLTTPAAKCYVLFFFFLCVF